MQHEINGEPRMNLGDTKAFIASVQRRVFQWTTICIAIGSATIYLLAKLECGHWVSYFALPPFVAAPMVAGYLESRQLIARAAMQS
jgi:hypothetical protein